MRGCPDAFRGYPTRRLSDPAPKLPRAHRAWLLLLPLAFIELVGSLVVRARVPEADDWHEAAAHITGAWAEGDQLTVAPRWADPLLRQAMGVAMGDAFTNAIAAPVGLEGTQRLWVVSIRGRASSLVPPDAVPEAVDTFGRVRVERYFLGEGEQILFDFVDRLPEATVTRGSSVCASTTGRASGGGLGAGPVIAANHFSCRGESVGETVIEDLHFEARRCIAQRAVTGEPIQVRFLDVPLGERIVLYGGLHWVDERAREGAPVTLEAWAQTDETAEVSLGAVTHLDGDGWATYEITVPDALRGSRASVRFEVRSEGARSFCWAGRSLARTAEGL